jgi:DNA-binding NarL/FixJ family response regulator
MEEDKKVIRLFVIDNHETIIVSGFHQLFRPSRDFIEIIGSASSINAALISDVIQSCDIIILDLWIPDEKPLENVRMLKDYFPGKPILIYSTEDSPEWIRKMMIAGVQGYVTKEAFRPDLKSSIQSIAAGKVWFPRVLEENDLEVTIREPHELEIQLSPAQRKILSLLSKGNNHKEIADILNIKVKNIEKILSILRKNFNAKTTVELIKILTEKTMI